MQLKWKTKPKVVRKSYNRDHGNIISHYQYSYQHEKRYKAESNSRSVKFQMNESFLQKNNSVWL